MHRFYRWLSLSLLIVLSGCTGSTPAPPPSLPPRPEITGTAPMSMTVDVPLEDVPTFSPFPTPPGILHDVALEGYYHSSFEFSGFQPCAGVIADDSAQSFWWLEATEESGFYDRYRTLSPPPSSARVYVKLRGDVWPQLGQPQGGYGHLNAFPQQVTVTQVITMSVDGQCAP